MKILSDQQPTQDLINLDNYQHDEDSQLTALGPKLPRRLNKSNHHYNINNPSQDIDILELLCKYRAILVIGLLIVLYLVFNSWHMTPKKGHDKQQGSLQRYEIEQKQAYQSLQKADNEQNIEQEIKQNVDQVETDQSGDEYKQLQQKQQKQPMKEQNQQKQIGRDQNSQKKDQQEVKAKQADKQQQQQIEKQNLKLEQQQKTNKKSQQKKQQGQNKQQDQKVEREQRKSKDQSKDEQKDEQVNEQVKQEQKQEKKQEKKQQQNKSKKQKKEQQSKEGLFDFFFKQDKNKQQKVSDDEIIKYYQDIQKQEQGQQVAQNNLSKQLVQAIKQTRYYDIHYFIEDIHTVKPVRTVQASKSRNEDQMYQKRDMLKVTFTPQQLQLIINKMMYPANRPPKMPEWEAFRKKTVEQIDLIYYNYELSLNPQRSEYLQAEYYRLDKLYNIGKYDKQLPLCIVLVGRNDAEVVHKCYDSILRQNYTNYRVVHVDDNSDDGTIEKVIDYLKDKAYLKDRVTLLSNKYQRNALYNRNFGIMEYCNEDDIIVDMDADDWIIGRQVFQMVNSIYQTGNFYNGKREDLWLAYTSNIGYIKGCCPYVTLVGQIPDQVLEKQRYRYEAQWRTTELRTYLWKLYQKINKTDMIDPLMLKQGEFYVQAYDTYMNYGMVQMSGPKHIRILDQFDYFYTGSPPRGKYVQTYYCQLNIQTMRGYQKIRTINDVAKRMSEYQPDQKKVAELKDKKIEVKQKLDKLKLKIFYMYQKDQEKVALIQKRKVYRKIYQDKKLGGLEYLATNISKLQPSNLKTGFFYDSYGLQDRILVGSSYDYINISRYVNLTVLEKRLVKSIAHEVWRFNYDQLLDQGRDIQIDDFIGSQKDLKDQIKKIKTAENFIHQQQAQQSNNHHIQYELSAHFASNSTQSKLASMEYFYANLKYQIGRQLKQAPICIISYEQNAFTLDRYKPFFESVQKLNYTNFHIVYVDDNSENDDAYEIYKYLKSSKMRIKNKMKLIKNLQKLGELASIQIWAKTYCEQDEIVVLTKASDKFLGTQGLKILNSIYQDQQKWLVYSGMMTPGETPNKYYTTPTKVFTTFNQDIRNMQSSMLLMKSFRKKLLDAVPFEHFIEYQYKKDTGMGYIRYYETSASKILITSLIEVSGKQRTKYLADFLLLDNPVSKTKCQKIHQTVQQLRYRLKMPARRIGSLDQKSQLEQSGYSDGKTLQRLLNSKQTLKNCEMPEKN